jgi:hypothetical protein
MREGKGRNAAARQAFLEAYREDHPELVSDDIDAHDPRTFTQHFDYYRKRQKQMCKVGKSDLNIPPGQKITDFATDELIETVVNFLEERGELNCQPSEARELLRRYLETPEALEALRRERTP